MAKISYNIISNFDQISEERRREIIEIWNFAEAELIIKGILELPLYLQHHVLENIKKYFNCTE